MEQTFSKPHTGAPDYEYDPSAYYEDIQLYMDRLLQDLFIMHYQSCSWEMRKHLKKAAELRKWTEVVYTLTEIDKQMN